MEITNDGDLKQLMDQKAADLFAICDKEDKGFVTKRDMQRMLNLDDGIFGCMEPDQLESVFDALDSDGNGYLTLEEFSEGFQHFNGVPDGPESLTESGIVEEQLINHHGAYGESCQTQYGQDKGKLQCQPSVAFEYDDHFEQLLDELGIREVIGEDDEALRTMWNNLKLDPNPDMMAGFEAVLSRLTGDLEKKQVERRQMESAYQSRNKIQEEHLKQAYEDMEIQIQKERETIRKEEERKHEKAQRELEDKLSLKDMQLQQMIAKQNSLEDKLNDVYKEVPEIKDENAHLVKEKNILEREVERQRTLFQDMQDHMDELRSHTKEEKMKRAKAAFKVTENIAKERHDLVNQLHHLKDVNKNMMDQKDMEIMGNASGNDSNKDGENMGMIQQDFCSQNNDVQNNDRNETLDKTISDVNPKGDVISKLNVLNNMKDTSRQDQVYISLQSPSREDNPITAFVKPPDFISLKPLTQDEEKAILMQGKGGGADMRRMREFAPIMSSPENPEGMQNTIFPPTIGMDKSDCECDDAYFEQTMAAAQICDPINSHPAGHHLVQNGLPNHAGESCSLIQNHQAEIVSSANEHMMLAPTLSADDLINAVNRHRRLMRRHGSSQSACSNVSLLDEIAESFHTGVINHGTVSSLPLPVPEHDVESNIEDERSEKNDNDKDEFSCDDELDDAEDSSIAELGSSIPSSIPAVHKRGGHLNNRPPLRRKRSMRNGKPRLYPYNNGSMMYPNTNSSLSGNIERSELNNHPHFGRRPSELGSVADESLTSCTGPISQDDSDFSSFNLNSASMGASSKNFKKDENLSDELCFANQTNTSTPISKPHILSEIRRQNNYRVRTESFSAEPRCDDHPPIFGTKENTTVGFETSSPGFPTCAFKVIFVGDSSVGKTSIISRLCKNKFDASVGATVGVDFQTRLISVENTSICLQCWDTAGQERYRSLTRQYFRKSDAVVIVYDVTNESSFLNAREWMTSAKEVISVDRNYSADEMESIVFMLVGNKLDLADEENRRGVRKADGLKLAKQNSAMFFEVSAMDGRNIESAVAEMSALLKKNFDKDLERGKHNGSTISLQTPKKKKGCWC